MRFAKAITLCLCLLALSLPSFADSETDRRVQSALTWLPKDAQSIVVTPLSEGLLGQDDLSVMSPHFGAWHVHFLKPIWPLGDMKVADGEPQLCIEAVCRLPKLRIDGGNPSCQFFFFDEQSSFNDTWESQITSRAADSYKDCDKEVVLLRPLSGAPDGIPPFYMCHFTHGIVVSATDPSLLHTVLTRMSNTSTTRVALPDSLKEWSTVDTKAPFWGLRHFPKSDPTSPAAKIEKVRLDPFAIGMTFSYRPSDQFAKFSYLSSNPNIQKTARAFFGSGPLDKRTKESSAEGVVTMTRTTQDFPHQLWNRLAVWIGDGPVTASQFEQFLNSTNL